MHLSDSARALAARCLTRVNEVARHASREDFATLPGYAGLPDDMKDLEIAATVRHGLRSFLGSGTRTGKRPGEGPAKAEGRPGEGPAEAERRPGEGPAEAVGRPGEGPAAGEGRSGEGPAEAERRSGQGPETAEQRPGPETAERRPGLRLFEERAEQRADEGMPLDLLLRAYLRGARVIARLLRETTRPGEEAALAELLEALLAAQEDVVGTLTRGYLRARAVLADDARRAHESLVRALLAGDRPHPGDLGILSGAEQIGVLVLLVPDAAPLAAEGGSGPDPVAVRRAERRVRLALARALDADVPVAFERERAYALLPGAPEATGLARRLGAAFGGACPHAGLAPAAGPEAVAAAARTADRVLTVAVACGRPPGVHELPDVLLEYHLAQPGESGSRIAALLDPVAGRPELTDTVRVHLRLARNRRATARELGVHPNTVDNRLARFHVLTGIDVATDQGAALVLAATLQRDAQRGGPSALVAGSPDAGAARDARTPRHAGTPRHARPARDAGPVTNARPATNAGPATYAGPPSGTGPGPVAGPPQLTAPATGTGPPPAVGTGPDSAPLSPAHATHLPAADVTSVRGPAAPAEGRSSHA